jgi:hypothetical protein
MDSSSALSCEQNLLLQKYGDKFQSFGKQNFIVSLSDDVTLFVIAAQESHEVIVNDGGVEKDITYIYLQFLERDPDSCAVEVCKWVEEKFLHRDVAYGFDDVYKTVDNETNASQAQNTDCLNSKHNIGAQVTKIYSWGNGCRVRKPEDSDANFSACALTCHNKGLNLKCLTGTNKAVQNCVRESPKFSGLIQDIVDKVSSDATISTISINCTRGKHRSVAIAEFLKAELFPFATVVHLEIRR